MDKQAHIFNLIGGREWHIDAQSGAQYLAKYEHQIALLQSGVEKASIFGGEPNSNISYETAVNGQRIAVIRMSGPMMLEDMLCSDGMRTIGNQIRTAANSASIDAIVVSMNTGGGEVLAGQELYNAIGSVKKPLVVHGETIASAGVLGALQADAIYLAGEFSKMGSIGVMTSINTMFLARYKEVIKDVYATTSPDKNAEFNAALEGNFQPLIESLTKTDAIFMDTVKANRPLRGDVEKTLSGAMFTAKDAVDRGLADGILTIEGAIESAAQMAEDKKKGKFKKKNKTNMTLLESIAQWFGGTKMESAVTEATKDKEQAEAIAAVQTLIDQNAAAMEAMETKVSDLAATVSKMETTANEMQSQIDALTAANTDLATKLQAVTAERDALASEKQTLENEANDLRGQLAGKKLAENRPRFQQQAADISAIEKRVNKQFDEIKIKVKG